MKKCIAISFFLLFLLQGNAAEKSSYKYMVLTGNCFVTYYDQYNREKEREFRYITPVIKISEEMGDDELAKDSLKNFIMNKQKGCRMGGVECQSFTDRKEAMKEYKELSKGRDKLSFTRSRIEKTVKEYLKAVEKTKKEMEEERKKAEMKK